MKKIISLMLISLFTLLLCASCSGGSVDDQFVSSFEKGLSARWTKMDQMKEQEESTKYWNTLIDAELDKVADFDEKTFENKDLGEAAKSYVTTLKEMKKITKYVDTNYDKFYTKYNKLYNDRAVAMYKISQLTEISFSKESDKDQWESFLEEGKTYSTLNDLKSTMQFALNKDEWGYTTGTLVLENTTGTDFEYISWDIAIKDANGTVLETAYAQAEHWKVGQKTTFEFFTDVEFSSYEIVSFDFTEE